MLNRGHRVRDSINTAIESTGHGDFRPFANMIWSAIRVLLFIAVFTFVISIGNVFQVSTRNHTISITKDAALDAKAAASDAKRAVEDAIKQSQEGRDRSGLDSTAILNALQAINRIEFALCAGPCTGG